METVYELESDQTVDCGSFSQIAVVFNGEASESGCLIIGGNTYKIENRNGDLVFDSGGVGEHEFSFLGETFLLKIGASYYPITLVNDSGIVFTIYKG